MWMYRVKNEEKYGQTPTKVLFGIPFVNGYGFVEKWLDQRFFSTNDDFEDITPDEFKDINNECKKILIKVPGGVGDSLFTTPMIDALKQKYGEKLQIDFLGSKYSLEVLLHNPRINRFIPEPIMHVSKIEQEYDDVLDLGCTIENNPEAEFENAYKITCDAFNLKPPEYTPIVYVTPDEVKKAKNFLADMNVPQNAFKIGVHIESTSPLRAFPRNKVVELLNELSTLGYVFPFSIGGTHKGRQNITCEKCSRKDSIVIHDSVKAIDFTCSSCKNVQRIEKEPENPKVRHIISSPMRTTVGLIHEMDVMVCIDSGLLHVSAGLEKPIIALFSNFDGALRTSTFKNCITMNTTYKCAPCHLNNTPRCPPMLRMKVSEPPCVNEFKVNDIVKYVHYIYRQNGREFNSFHVNTPPPVKIERKNCTVCGHFELDIIARKKDVAHARCLKCDSIIALSPSPQYAYSEEDYHDVFDSETIKEENYGLGKELGNHLSELLGSGNANRVIEIGCSNGSTLKGFYDSGWIPYGIEISENVVSKIEYPWKSNIFTGDLYKVVEEFGKKEWNWPGRSPIKVIKNEDGSESKHLRLGIFECVLMQHTLEHFDDPIKAFQTASSLVGPKGYLTIGGPSASAMNRIGTSKNMHLNTLIPGEHQAILSQKAFIQLAEACEYEVISYKENERNSNMFAILRKKY